MTAREHLNRRKRWLGLAVLAGIVLVAVGGALAASGEGAATAVPVVAGVILLVAGAMVGQFVVLRCPWCRGNLGMILMNAGWWRIDPRVKFCPFCAAALDAELADPAGESEKDAAGW